MLRYKQIAGSGQALEDSVNAWLEKFEPDVTQLVQTQLQDGSLLIGFLFKESFRGQELRLSTRNTANASPTAPPEDLFPDTAIHVRE
jgi:hypothetical protein